MDLLLKQSNESNQKFYFEWLHAGDHFAIPFEQEELLNG